MGIDTVSGRKKQKKNRGHHCDKTPINRINEQIGMSNGERTTP